MLMSADFVTLEELIAARTKVAKLVLMDRVYLPIFARLEREIATLEAETDLIARARAVVQIHNAAG